MKSIFTILFFFFFNLNLIYSQSCLPNGIHFNSQNQIDNFPINYPGCVEIGGEIWITGSDITNLEGLSGIISIGEYLEITNCDALESLTGLDSLSFIGEYLLIRDNDALVDLTGLNGLITVGNYVDIEDNPSLLNLNGLNSLINVGNYFRVENNESLINLNGLESLSNIEGSIFIDSNDELISLEGMSSFSSTNSHFTIKSNASLPDLSGLENLTFIDGFFSIHDNPSLTSLTGLENLHTIDRQLNIEGNNSLTSLVGLENLIYVKWYLHFIDNDSLSSLAGLENLNHYYITYLSIIGNPLLSTCEENFVCNYLEWNQNPFEIENNAPGCNSYEEILFNCGYRNKVNHPIFWDVNENKIHDNGEPFYPIADIKIDPGNLTVYGNSINGGLTYLEEGNYTFTYDQSSAPNWELVTDSISYNLELGNSSIDTIYFGVKPVNNISDLNPILTSNPIRCSEYVLFNIIGYNQGTNSSNGTIWFQFDEDIVDTIYIDTPDTIIGQSLFGWNFSGLYPGVSLVKHIKLKIPGPPIAPIGSFLFFESWITYQDVNGEHISDTFSYSTEIQCSYDPNDKLVNPVYPNNFALIGEDLIYTIRFQNTGNAEAYDVIIRDTLDENLDPSTFKVISSSHEEVLSTTLAEGKYLTFTFHDIFLPDSTSNFEGSQGYVAYRIKAYEGIDEETVINNTAGIYFDLNPPVITNTTENVMLSTFDFDEDGFDLFVDCDDMNEDINPDAEEIPNNGIDENCDELDTPVSTNDLSTLPIDIYPNPTNGQITILLPPNLIGAKLKVRDFNGKTLRLRELGQQTQVNLSDVPSGVYLLMIQTDELIWTERIVKM